MRCKDNIHILSIALIPWHIRIPALTQRTILGDQLLRHTSIEVLPHNRIGHFLRLLLARIQVSDATTSIVSLAQDDCCAANVLVRGERPFAADELASVILDVLEDVVVLVCLEKTCLLSVCPCFGTFDELTVPTTSHGCFGVMIRCGIFDFERRDFGMQKC